MPYGQSANVSSGTASPHPVESQRSRPAWHHQGAMSNNDNAKSQFPGLQFYRAFENSTSNVSKSKRRNRTLPKPHNISELIRDFIKTIKALQISENNYTILNGYFKIYPINIYDKLDGGNFGEFNQFIPTNQINVKSKTRLPKNQEQKLILFY